MANAEYIMYKGKPLVRNNDALFYGNPEDIVIVSLEVKGRQKEGELEVPTRVSVNLLTNDDSGKARIIKHADRDSLFKALDIGEFWLRDYLEKAKEMMG